MFFKKKPNNPEEIKITLFSYPTRETLDSVIKTVDETDKETSVKVICTLTQEVLARRENGKWQNFWYAEGLEANLNYNLMQFKLA